MKVTLISLAPDSWAPGPRILSSCLKQEGHDVLLLFLQNKFTQDYSEKILDDVVELSKDSNLIGISLMTNFFYSAVQIIQRLKKNHNIPIIMGGIHPTIRPEECLNYADIVCIGEGEESLVELVNKMSNGAHYYDTQGLWFKVKDKIIKNQSRPMVKDLDLIPFQDYDYEHHYMQSNGGLCQADEGILKESLLGIFFAVYAFMTLPSRGCPFSCAYCTNNILNSMYSNRNKVRKRSPGNIIRELIDMRKKLPFIEMVWFDDDSFFTYTIDEITDFSKQYKENIGLPLSIAGITPLTLTREKLLPLVDGGLKFLRMGIQTGSERTLKLYKRNMSNQKVEQATKIINEFKDKVMANYDIILDNPWEREEDLIETLMFLSKLPTPYILNLYSLSFFPETELYRKAKNDGIIVDDKEDVYRKYYCDYKKNYINNLFALLSYYTSERNGISPKIMSLLTNQKIRQIGLHKLFYFMLKWPKYKSLVSKGLKDIQKGDWTRIRKYTKKIMNVSSYIF